MWEQLGIALALLLVMEGIMPFLSPERLRDTLQTIIEMDDTTLRIMGFISMAFGVILLYLIH